MAGSPAGVRIARLQLQFARAAHAGVATAEPRTRLTFPRSDRGGFRSGRSLPDYARALHVSEARLRNACLGAGGQPPIQLLHARVLLEAKRQLIYTSLPIAEIAYGLGFDDPAYFTRFFTRRAGVCPRTYRSQGA